MNTLAPPPHSLLPSISCTKLLCHLQVADRPSKNTVSVGGAVLVVSSELEESQRLRGTTNQLSSPPSPLLHAVANVADRSVKTILSSVPAHFLSNVSLHSAVQELDSTHMLYPPVCPCMTQ